MNREDAIKFVLNHPESVDGIKIQFNKKAIPQLLESKLWPKAVQDSLIVDENDKEQIDIRARAIMTRYVKEDLAGKKFLDFGAGNSGCVRFAENAGEAVAYDIVKSEGVITDFEEVKSKGPYDVILLYDVIDHIVGEDGKAVSKNEVSDTLKLVASLLKADGVIYVRCHPWTARHGTHSYKKRNKAFIQYCEEDHGGIPTVKIVEPVFTYKTIFEEAGLKIGQMEKVEQVLEPIFEDSIFENWEEIFTWRNKGIFRQIMTINFIDYKISRK